jgi:methyl-accepting chemotaxis protein
MQIMKNATMARRIGVAFAGTIMVFLISSGICLSYVRSIDQKEQDIQTSAQVSSRLKDGFADYLNIIWAALANNLNGKPGHKTWIVKHGDDFVGRILEIRSAETSGSGAALADDCLKEYRSWMGKVVQPMLAMRENVDRHVATQVELSELTESFGPRLGTEKLISALEKLENYNADRSSLVRQDLALLRTRMYITILGANLLAVVAAIIAGSWLTRSVSGPLRKAVFVAARVADGDLTTHIEHTSRDETGMLMASLKTMNGNLLKIAENVRKSTDLMVAASSEIAMGNLDLSARTEEQASCLEQTSASMTQIADMATKNAGFAHEAADMAVRATDVSDRGSQLVLSMVQTIGRINTESGKISAITDVIENIAFQTNILALNAAVEAARAGEQGRGFAVVAAEVRGLAQRSAVAANEIKELLVSSAQIVAAGVKQADNVATAMEQVRASIKAVASFIGEIAVASADQSSRVEQINLTLNEMDKATQQNAALVEEAASAASSLENQAMSLKRAVSVFKLDHEEVI